MTEPRLLQPIDTGVLGVDLSYYGTVVSYYSMLCLLLMDLANGRLIR